MDLRIGWIIKLLKQYILFRCRVTDLFCLGDSPLHTQSAFGAEYDSLSDMVSFGAAPSLVIYEWALRGMGKLGWIAAFIYCAGAALRLARAFELMAPFKCADTPVGVVKSASRKKQETWITSLGGMDFEPVDMTSLVIVGNAATYVSQGRMITPRGYQV